MEAELANILATDIDLDILGADWDSLEDTFKRAWVTAVRRYGTMRPSRSIKPAPALPASAPGLPGFKMASPPSSHGVAIKPLDEESLKDIEITCRKTIETATGAEKCGRKFIYAVDKQIEYHNLNYDPPGKCDRCRALDKAAKICPYHAAGHCKKADACDMVHDKPAQSAPSSFHQRKNMSREGDDDSDDDDSDISNYQLSIEY